MVWSEDVGQRGGVVAIPIITFIFRCRHKFLNGDFTPWCKFGVKNFDFD